MDDRRLGRQTPTKSVILPYQATKGQDAIELYNKTGRKAQEWQELMMYDILAFNDEDLWTHTKFGYSIPRRNGKNEIVAMRELYGLFQGEHMLHTAHKTTTSHSAWERLIALLKAIGYEETQRKMKNGQVGKYYTSFKQYGLEDIRLQDGSGGVINFRTRTSNGGLGEGFDTLIIDEAQEYRDDQETALKYVVSDSMNPQTIFCGTPPTPVSKGTVFTKLRKDALEGCTVNTGWAEWSVDSMSDVHNVDLWYETNPSMGTILNERKVTDEIGTDNVDFNIQRLGLWLKYNQKSAITPTEWNELQAETLPPLTSRMFVGIKYGHDGNNVAVSFAIKSNDKIFVESRDCQSVRNGTDWIVSFLANADVQQVVIDGASGQAILDEEIRNATRLKPILPTVKEIIEANSLWEKAIYGKTITHMNQPSLTNVVTNCEKRAIGTNGGFGYRAIKEGAESALMDSAILAHWLCANAKETHKQTISY